MSSDSDEEKDVLEIEAVRIKNGKKQYYVHWADEDKTWEPEENLRDDDGTDCLTLIKFFVRTEIEKAATTKTPQKDEPKAEPKTEPKAERKDRYCNCLHGP